MKINHNNRTYYPNFDYLRALCAIAVMLYHSHVLKWEHSGNLAVQVFFALSGWLIGGILIETKPSELPRFYFNRAIRIWIPYYIAIGIAIALGYFRDSITQKWLEIVIYKLTFVYNIFGTSQLTQYADQMPLKATLSHVWSVNAEEQFYLIAPLLLVISSKYFGKNPVTWLILAAGSLTFDLYPAIVLGVLSAVLVANKKNPLNLTSNISRIGLSLSLIATTLLLSIHSFYYFAAPLFSISLVLLLARPGKQSRFGQLAGGMSYPLYLNHWIGVYAMNFLLPSLRNTLASAIASSMLSILIATGMYVFIDEKIIKKRNLWHSQQREQAATLGAYFLLIFGAVYGYFQLHNH